MFKKIILVGFMMLSCGFVFAQEDAVDAKTADLMQTLKQTRSDITNAVGFTPEQLTKINELDVAFYSEIEPEIRKIAGMTQRLEDIANSENCTKEAVYAVKREFKGVEKNMNSINRRYAKKYKVLMTPEQKAMYREVRAQKRAELQKQIEAQRGS